MDAKSILNGIYNHIADVQKLLLSLSPETPAQFSAIEKAQKKIAEWEGDFLHSLRVSFEE